MPLPDEAAYKTPMELIVNAGHTEYWPRPLTDDLVVATFDSYDEQEKGTFGDLQFSDTPDDDALRAAYRNIMGEDPDDDEELSWGTIVKIAVTREQLEACLDDLIGQLSLPPTGDDSAFDYWPSGCRMAVALASHLDAWELKHYGNLFDVNRHVDRARRVIRGVRDLLHNDMVERHGLSEEWPDSVVGLA